MGSWSFHTTTNGYITYSMSEHGMCTPTDPRFHKKREDFRYVYTCLTVLYTNSLKKVRPAPPRDVDVSSPSRRVARPRRDVDVATDRARVPARLSSLVSSASPAFSRENPARARRRRRIAPTRARRGRRRRARARAVAIVVHDERFSIRPSRPTSTAERDGSDGDARGGREDASAGDDAGRASTKARRRRRANARFGRVLGRGR